MKTDSFQKQVSEWENTNWLLFFEAFKGVAMLFTSLFHFVMFNLNTVVKIMFFVSRKLDICIKTWQPEKPAVFGKTQPEEASSPSSPKYLLSIGTGD